MMTTTMTDKTTKALKLADMAIPNLLWAATERDKNNRIRGFDSAIEQAKEALFVIREALTEQEPVYCQQRDTKEYEEMVKRQRQYLNQDGSRKDGVAEYAAPVSVESEWIETNKALAKEIIEQRNQYLDKLAEAIDLSVNAEREACANLMFNLDLCGEEGKAAAAIRARGEK